MDETRMRTTPIRFVAPIPGVPEAQARALDRRHRLERQQRAFRGPHFGLPIELVGPPVIEAAGPGPA